MQISRAPARLLWRAEVRQISEWAVKRSAMLHASVVLRPRSSIALRLRDAAPYGFNVSG